MDVKDPAVPLNFAVFLHNRKESEEAKKMLQMFEMRVQRLRQTPPGLDADPDVSTWFCAFSRKITQPSFGTALCNIKLAYIIKKNV